MLKIFHSTDLHFNKHWFEWIKSQEKDYDVFCLTGDFLDDSKVETLTEQIDWVSNWMKQLKKPLFVCSGNHDIEELDNEDWLNKILNIYSDNSIKRINGIKFGCIPYIAPDFLEFDECDVILYHIPPAKTKTSIHENTNVDWGDKEFHRILEKRIISPKIALCGHLHHPLNIKDKINDTKIYNVGSNKHSLVPNFTILEI